MEHREYVSIGGAIPLTQEQLDTMTVYKRYGQGNTIVEQWEVGKDNQWHNVTERVLVEQEVYEAQKALKRATETPEEKQARKLEENKKVHTVMVQGVVRGKK